MSAYKLSETTVSLLEEHIKQNISGALLNVRTERDDGLVTTEIPQSYFQYETSNVYRSPALFTLIRTQSFRESTMQANHINSLCDVTVAVVVEDRIEDRVLKKSWRYQCALMEILHQTSLTNADESVKLFLRVRDCQFSGLISIKDRSTSSGVFRKEVSLNLDVDHIERFQTLT